LTFESGCSQLRADHGDDLGDPEAPEVEVLQRAGVGHRALEGSGQAHPCISLNVVTESKKSGAVVPEPSRPRIAHTGVPESPRKKSGRWCRIGAEVFVEGVSGRPRGGAPKEKGTAIMKLTTTTQVSVDGVVQGNGGPDENRSGGFERGGWARPLFDDEAMTFVDQVYQRADAFLLGRRTYELFAGYWGVREDLGNPIVGALNTKPKYVASNTLTEPRWANTTVLSGDLAAAIGELKAKPAGELQVHGSGALTRWLLENDLVDEMNLLIVPVVVGQGTRLFPDTGPDIALDLVESRAFPKGITIQVYRPAGRPQYATD
jgi:dihydrofolate reductase